MGRRDQVLDLTFYGIKDPVLRKGIPVHSPREIEYRASRRGAWTALIFGGAMVWAWFSLMWRAKR